MTDTRFRPPGALSVGPLRTVLSLLVLLFAGGCDPTAPEEEAQVDILVPTEVLGDLRFTHVGAGWFHTCATAVGGTVYCWGKNEYGELGSSEPADRCDDGVFYENVSCSGQPQVVAGAPPLRELEGSDRHSCGVDEEDQAWCWGYGMGGQLGDGQRSSRAAAAPVAGTVEFARLSLSVGGTSSCGLGRTGVLYCWGSTYETDMGADVGDTPTRMPTQLHFQMLDQSDLAACGLSDGEAWCWGSNWYGQLGVGGPSGGDGGVGASELPVRVVGGHRFTHIAMSLSHTCGLRTDGATYCWGSLPALHQPAVFRYGTTPVAVGGPTFAELEAGGNHSCGLTGAGEAWCWGANGTGLLGDGTRSDRGEPTRVAAPGGIAFQSLALGGAHSCGLATDGRLFCWGHNGFGQAGQRPGWLLRGG